MWYRKNVGGWERAARLIGGSLMLICGVVALHASPLGLLLSGAGVVTLVTGVFGYCPACAVAERKPAHGDFWIRGLDGTRRHIQATAFPLMRTADQVLGAVAIFWEMSS